MRILRLSPRLLLCGLLAAGLIASLAGRSFSEEANEARARQIAELEKQISDLQKKLAALRSNGDTVAAAGQGTLLPTMIKPLTWRCIGPAAMGGRIIALSVFEADPSTYWVATASGGLLKTTNNGITFEHQFDHESTVSVGDVCVAPSDRNIVWVGTGENNPRNSVSYGDGVYKSTDGGKTWKNMGLHKSFQTGRIVVHPKNPDIVYVGALGRLYGPNEERGLFKTTDGGKTWNKILYVDDKTGIIEMQMNPADPENLLVATYERQRDTYDTNDPSKKVGPGTGLYRTTDGGKTFSKITKGLPTCQLGRIGISYFHKDPKIVYMILESEKIGTGVPQVYLGLTGENAPNEGGAKLNEVVAGSPAEKAGLKKGDVIVSLGDKPVKTYADIANLNKGRKVGDKVKVTILREGKPQEVEVTLGNRPAAQPGQRRGGGGGGPATGGVFLGFMGESVEDTGVRITRVLDGSPAEKAGLQEGDVITRYGDKSVKSFTQLQEQNQDRKPGDKVKLQVSRSGKTITVELTLGDRPAFGGGGGFGRPTDPNKPFIDSLGGQRENIQDQQGPEGFQYGGVYKSTDGGESWTRINSLNPRPMYFSHIRVDPSDANYVYVCGISLYRSTDGGKTFKNDGGRRVHADQHALWIDPKDGRHMIVGCDGGFYVTYDRMDNWDRLNTLAIGQFYHCAVDTRPDYRVYGGLQDNGSWGGPSRTHTGTGPINEDWIMVGGGDGFVCRVDPNDPDLVYYESQNGGFGRRNLRTGETASIRPPRGQGQANRFRFNWNSPFILSHHNSRVYYCAGNVVFRSWDRGNDLQVISPDITATPKGSALALGESPRNPNVLYVGTDDGYLWVTRDGGKEWVNITKNVGLPGLRTVATVEPSRFADGRCYVAFDAHRQDDDDPHVYVTDDFGKTWKSLRGNLPWGSTRCLREDIQNPDLLFLGTEFGAWASIDRGQSWTKLNNNLPTVAVHEFAIHPTAGEVVAATHGRSLWVLDVTPLRQMTTSVVQAKAHLFRPNPAIRQRPEPEHGGTNRRYVGQNPTPGAQLYYTLAKKPEAISLKILDYTGKTIRELKADPEPGLHHVTWDLALAPARRGGPPGAGGPAEERGGGRGARGGRGTRTGGAATGNQPAGTGAQPAAPGAQPGGTGARPAAGGTGQPTGTTTEPQPQGGFRGMFGRGQPVPAGIYRVVLNVDGEEFSQGLRVEGDISGQGVIIADDDDDD